MKKFEYKVLNLTAKDLSDEAFLDELNRAFNKWGSEGCVILPEFRTIVLVGYLNQKSTTHEKIQT